MFDACTSDPPASGSSRSRHARIDDAPQTRARRDVTELRDDVVVPRFGYPARAGIYASRTARFVFTLTLHPSARRRPTTLARRQRRPVARLTGERPMAGATPDSLLALHDAGYREVAARLGAGVVLDVGCGVGDADRAARARRPARRRRRLQRADGRRHRTRTTYRSAPPLRGHGRRPTRSARRRDRRGRVVAHHRALRESRRCTSGELARVLRPDGTAFVITPNAPADFENPFHVYLFEPEHLVSMLGLCFEEVECLGLDGDDSAPGRLRRPARERRTHPAARPARAPPPHPAPRLRLDVRTRAADRVPPPRFGDVGSRFGHRRGTPLHHADASARRRPCCSRSRAVPRRSDAPDPDHDGRGHARLGHDPDVPRGREHRSGAAARAAMPHRRRRSSSSTTAARTARPTRPRRWQPSWATSRSCAGRARWGSGARTATVTRPASPAATTSSSRSTPTSRTTRPTSPAAPRDRPGCRSRDRVAVRRGRQCSALAPRTSLLLEGGQSVRGVGPRPRSAGRNLRITVRTAPTRCAGSRMPIHARLVTASTSS